MHRDLLIYFLQVQVAFGALYGLWWLTLRKNPLHRTNRFVLLAMPALALVLPLLGSLLPSPIQPTPLPMAVSPLEIAEWAEAPSALTWTPKAQTNAAGPSWFYLGWLFLISIATSRMLLVLWQGATLWRRAAAYPNFQQNGIRYCYTEGVEGPSSFFRWIFLPTRNTATAVLAHEEAHVRQGHSWDILLSEIWLSAFWWNPIGYRYRRSLREVHEFLADETALKQVPLLDYLHTLTEYLSQRSLQTGLRLTPAFTHASITKRLYMMKKRPTTTWQRAAYALLIPGIAVLLWSFSHKNEDIKATAAAATPPIAWQWSPVEDLAKSEPNGYPLPRENTVVTSEFGMRMHPITKEEAFHRGQDFKAKVGTPIYATGEGIVIKVELINEGTGYGHHVILQHGEHFQTLYSCMDKIMVEEGQTVRRGLQIGTVGNTGMSTAPHLHYEIHKDGTAVNPKEYLGKRNNTDEC